MEDKINGLSLIQNMNTVQIEDILDDDVYADDSIKIAQRVCNKMHSYGSKVTDEISNQIEIAAKILLNNLKTDKPVVIPIECGLGKSTLIQEYLKYMLDMDPDFGAIVVKERVDDMLKLEKELKGKAKAVYSFYSEQCQKGFKTYSRKECSNCEYNEKCAARNSVKQQNKYQIAIISDERYRINNLYSNNMEDLLYYYDEKGNKKKRSLVIIDEKPPMALNKGLSRIDLEKVYEVFSEVSPTSDSYDEIKKFNTYISQIVMGISPCFRKDDIYDTIDSNFNLSKESKEYFLCKYGENDIENLELIISIIKKGGIIQSGSYCKNISTLIYTINYINLNLPIKQVIFDGTAVFDAEYRPDKFAILDFKRIRRYSNLNIHNCQGVNLSKSSIINNEKPIDIDALLMDLSTICVSKVFFITHLMYEEKCKSKIYQSNLKRNNEVFIDHYGNVKGKNDYAKCNKMVAIGLNRKPDAFYLAKAVSLGVDINDIKFNSSRQGRFSNSDILNKIILSDIFTDLVQNFFRIKLRTNSIENIEIYTFLNNNRLLKMISDYFVNANITEWIPENFLKKYMETDVKHDKKILELANYIELKFEKESQEKSFSISKDQVRKDLNYKNKGTFRSHINSEFIKRKLQKCNVIITQKTLRKIG